LLKPVSIKRGGRRRMEKVKSWQDNASSVFVGAYGDLGLASMVDP
jgi:hypothetical protein